MFERTNVNNSKITNMAIAKINTSILMTSDSPSLPFNISIRDLGLQLPANHYEYLLLLTEKHSTDC